MLTTWLRSDNKTKQRCKVNFSNKLFKIRVATYYDDKNFLALQYYDDENQTFVDCLIVESIKEFLQPTHISVSAFSGKVIAIILYDYTIINYYI